LFSKWKKEGWGIAQVVEGLPPKSKAQNPNPSSVKKKKGKAFT
jgi:hypothetical protein